MLGQPGRKLHGPRSSSLDEQAAWSAPQLQPVEDPTLGARPSHPVVVVAGAVRRRVSGECSERLQVVHFASH